MAESTDSQPTAKEAKRVLVEHATRCWEAEQANAEAYAGKQNFVFSAIAFFLGLNLFQIQWWRESERAIPDDDTLGVIRSLVLISLAFLVFAFLFQSPLDRLTVKWRYRLARLLRAFHDFQFRVIDRVLWPHPRHRPKPITDAIETLTALLKSETQALEQPRAGLADVGFRSSHLLAIPEEFLESNAQSEVDALTVAFSRTYSAYLDLVKQNLEKAKRLHWSRRMLFVAIAINLLAVFLYLCQIR